MATSKSPNLGLLIDSNLTANAKSNLYKIDDLAATIKQDINSNTVIRSNADISLLPEDSSIGGSGSGGSITLGSVNQSLTTLTAYTSALNSTAPLGTLDAGTGGTKYLRLTYNSTLSGAVDTVADRVLSFDLEGANRSLVLGTNLSVSASTIATGSYTYSFPAISGTIVDTSSSQTLTGKSMSGSANSFSNIPYASLVLSNSLVNSDVSPSAAIAYSKLNLTGGIVNADVSSGAAITYAKLNLTAGIVDSDVSASAAVAGTKIAPDFGSGNVRTTGHVALARNASVATKLMASSSQISDITLTLPASAPTSGSVLRYNGVDLEWSTTAGAGTVQSVAAALSVEADTILSVSGSPITTTGTLSFDLETQVAASVLAGPSTGPAAKPTFRSLVDTDIPTITTAKLSDWSSAWDTKFSTKSTSDLVEGSNLYYTTARANTDFDTRLATKSTSDLAEGSNLYYTNSRADARITLQKGASNGLATLDGGGKIPASQLPSTVMEYKGTWNASTNSPTLADGVGDTGDIYLVSVAGTQNLGSGSITFAVGDWAVYSGTVWQKSINSNAVTSVNGYTGVVVLTTSDVSEGTNLYYTNARVDTRIATYKSSATWAPGDGTTKVVTHSLGTTDVFWNIYDISSGEEIWPDTAIRTDSNTLTFTSSAPPSGSGWKVLVRK